MTTRTKRYERDCLQLNGFQAVIWEYCHEYESDRPNKVEYQFSIQRLNTDEVMKAFSYGLDEIKTVLRLTRWAEAQIRSFYEEL